MEIKKKKSKIEIDASPIIPTSSIKEKVQFSYNSSFYFKNQLSLNQYTKAIKAILI